MDKPHVVVSYDTVNHPYELARDALLANPTYVFRHATASAATNDATLRLHVAGIDRGKDVAVGSYARPLGRLGDLLDAAVGHRIVEKSIDRFANETAGWLREELATRAVSPEAAGA